MIGWKLIEEILFINKYYTTSYLVSFIKLKQWFTMVWVLAIDLYYYNPRLE